MSSQNVTIVKNIPSPVNIRAYIMKKNILSIHYIRGISALMVVLFHFRGVLNDVYAQKDLGNILFRWGEIGVDAFFIISGFIICLSTKNKTPAKEFVLKRFFRIYPAYILFVAFSICVAYKTSPASMTDIINALLILPLDYSKGGPFFGYSYLTVAWSLFYEISFYLIYMLSMIISHKYRGLICSGMIAALVFIPQLLESGTISLNPISQSKFETLLYLNILTSPMMLTFIAGIAIYEAIPILRFISLHFSEWAIRILFYSGISFFIYCFLTGFNSWHGITNSVLFILPAITFAILYEMKIGVSENKPLTFLGDISYSLYLSHLIVLSILNNYGGEFYSLSHGFSKMFILVSSSLILSYLAYNVIEKPSTKLCRKLLSYRPRFNALT